jgi:hypothetical protein
VFQKEGEVRDGKLQLTRECPDSGWYHPGAITVNPGQVFEK